MINCHSDAVKVGRSSPRYATTESGNWPRSVKSASIEGIHPESLQTGSAYCHCQSIPNSRRGTLTKPSTQSRAQTAASFASIASFAGSTQSQFYLISCRTRISGHTKTYEYYPDAAIDNALILSSIKIDCHCMAEEGRFRESRYQRRQWTRRVSTHRAWSRLCTQSGCLYEADDCIVKICGCHQSWPDG